MGNILSFHTYRKKNPIGSTRSTQWVKKEQTYSFGITGADVRAIGSEDNYTIYFFVQGVYPNSPAARAGIKRGSSIMQINGEKLTMNNYWQHYLDLLIPASAFSLKITEEDMEGGTQEKDISSEANVLQSCSFQQSDNRRRKLQAQGSAILFILDLRLDMTKNYSMYSKNSKARISLT